MIELPNLFADASPPQHGERFEPLLKRGNVLIERIVSSREPAADLYEQRQDEWVALLDGEATLEVAGEVVEMRRGDHLHLAAGTPHRVVATSQGALWLAVHIHPEPLD